MKNSIHSVEAISPKIKAQPTPEKIDSSDQQNRTQTKHSTFENCVKQRTLTCKRLLHKIDEYDGVSHDNTGQGSHGGRFANERQQKVFH